IRPDVPVRFTQRFSKQVRCIWCSTCVQPSEAEFPVARKAFAAGQTDKMPVIPRRWCQRFVVATKFTPHQCVRQQTKESVVKLLLEQKFKTVTSTLRRRCHRRITNDTEVGTEVRKRNVLLNEERIVLIFLVEDFCRDACVSFKLKFKSADDMFAPNIFHTIGLVFKLT